MDIIQPVPFYCGTSNVVLPVKNKEYFPLEFKNRSRLAYYGSLFNSVEINSSFYKIPQPKTIARWAEEVPPGFRFTFKLWKAITHEKAMSFSQADLIRFIESISEARDRMGAVLVQFPPSLGANIPALIHLLGSIRERNASSDWDVAVEFRNSTWYNENIYRILEDHRTAVVLHDMPASKPPLFDVPVPFIYLRFHGPDGNYRSSYDDAFLHEYAAYIRDWNENQKQVYCYFNNTMGDAVRNLQRLKFYVDHGTE